MVLALADTVTTAPITRMMTRACRRYHPRDAVHALVEPGGDFTAKVGHRLRARVAQSTQRWSEHRIVADPVDQRSRRVLSGHNRLPVLVVCQQVHEH